MAQMGVSASLLPFLDISSIAPMEEMPRKLPWSLLLLQGGGVRISGAQVTFTDCNIYKNTAVEVSKQCDTSH